MGDNDGRMSGWEEGQEGKAGLETELGRWCSFVGHGVEVVRYVGEMKSIRDPTSEAA